jgi:hypothetical protein
MHEIKLMFVFNPSSGRIIILTLSGSATTCDYPAASGFMNNHRFVLHILSAAVQFGISKETLSYILEM